MRLPAIRTALLLTICFPTGTACAISLRWNTNSNPPVVEVIGIDQNALRQVQNANWQTEDWQKLFAVYAGQGDFNADMTVPAMSGTYSISNTLICFRPAFPLQPGVIYRAVLRPARLPATAYAAAPPTVFQFSVPQVHRDPTTVVTAVYPSSDVLPENLLKFYLCFSAPMQGGNVYDHIHLRDEMGTLIEVPFLEIDEELWDREMTRLTLFIDPGRIKRGVKPLEEIGPALEAGKRYTLEIDAAWRDGNGLGLRESFRKSFRVAPPDREAPSLASWQIRAPKAGKREPLEIAFPEPMDHALALRVISVVDPSGQLVNGTSTLSDNERRWSFEPQKSWTTGHYELQVQNTIEDLAGNNIGKVFEVDLFEGVQRRFTNAVLKRSFEVRYPPY